MQLYVITILTLLLAAQATLYWQHVYYLRSFVQVSCEQEEVHYCLEGALAYLMATECQDKGRGFLAHTFGASFVMQQNDEQRKTLVITVARYGRDYTRMVVL